MACAIALGVGEFLEYLKDAVVAKDVYDNIKSVCTTVTHAYNDGKKVIDTTRDTINTGKQAFTSGKKQLQRIKRSANKIRRSVKARKSPVKSRRRNRRRRR